MDYYGKRLATAASDHQVRIFNVREDGSHELTDTLAGFVYQSTINSAQQQSFIQ